MSNLAIAWRNPIPAHHVRRWQAVAKDSLRNVYAVQQLVKSGTRFEWSNTTCLELVHNTKKAAVEAKKSSVVKWLLTSIP